jgi:hypothetical protein
MTPKEKAQELVDLFYYPSLKWALIHAKECALKCVDEILKEIDWHEYEHPNDLVNYWFEVKEEIQNL